MLHSNVHMLDINVDQWRAAQRLVLKSGKQTPRIVVIHDHGTVQKARYSDGRALPDAPVRVDDAQELARSLYSANADEVEFVMVIERDAMDEYFARMQDAWTVTTDLDDFVTHTFALLDDYPDGIAVWPGPARSQLGLQWRLGASHDQIVSWVQHVEPDSWIVLGAHDGDQLSASLLIHFDNELEVDSVTTADPERMDISGDRQVVLERLVSFIRDQGGRVQYALSADVDVVEALLAASDKAAVLAENPDAVTLMVNH